MRESLADEFARQLAEDADDNDFGCWATDNRDRILAALRGNEEDAAAIARVRKAALCDFADIHYGTCGLPREDHDDRRRDERSLHDEHPFESWADVALANDAGEREGGS